MKQSEFFEMIENLSKYHREHEKFYSRSPLTKAIELQNISRVLKTFADRWNYIVSGKVNNLNPYMGCEDLNEKSAIQDNGVLFMEGEGEPPEIKRLKRDLSNSADDFGETGKWLSNAMKSSWESAKSLLRNPALADVLGERHRIIINDWHAASLSMLISSLIERALNIIETIDFTPEKIRKDIGGMKTYPGYLYSATELLDRAADMASDSAALVHDNERRWRVFRKRINRVIEGMKNTED